MYIDNWTGCVKLLQALQTRKAQTHNSQHCNHRVYGARWEVSPFPWRDSSFPIWVLWEFVVLAPDETALYLRVRTLCRQFCRFIEPLLQSRPLRPFISYRTFYLRFMEHAIRPDILRVPKYWGHGKSFVFYLSLLFYHLVVNLHELRSLQDTF